MPEQISTNPINPIARKSRRLWYAAFSILPLFFAVGGLRIYVAPYTYVQPGEPVIACDNGKTYPLRSNGFSRIHELAAYVNSSFADHQLAREDGAARKLCAYGLLNDPVPFRPAPAERNYKIQLGLDLASD